MSKRSKFRVPKKKVTPVFHEQTVEEDEKHVTLEFMEQAKLTGVINLHGKHLSTVPDKLFRMHEYPGYIPEKILDIPFRTKFESERSLSNWWLQKPLATLDLSSNVIKEIPNKIDMFRDSLTYLNMQDNCLTSLPPNIIYLKDLTTLLLNHNKITKLPDEELHRWAKLKVLSLNHNCLRTLPDCLVDLVMLEKLEMANNKIGKLPSGMGYLVRLTELDVSDNKLTELPPDIVNLRSMTKLNISKNRIKQLPESFGELRKLQILNAQQNAIETIPNFTGCECIQEMYFAGNVIKELPIDLFENMHHLKIFDLKDNKISVLPEDVVKLVQLIRLDLTNNELVEIPNTVSLLPHLQSLKLDGNNPKNVREDIVRAGTRIILRFLREKLADEDVAALPVGLGGTRVPPLFPDRHIMRQGNILNLAMKDLAEVPEELFSDAKEVGVAVVDMCKNRFTQVPQGLLRLSESLTELNVSSNRLTQVPAEFANFTNLKLLDLSQNVLGSLPDRMGTLVGLRELVLASNRFAKIPGCIFGMVGLEILMLNDNRLSEIDVDGLKKLTRLTTLSVANNDISYVPPELGLMTQIRCLEIKGNSFRQPRYAILDKGTESILAYLRDKIAV